MRAIDCVLNQKGVSALPFIVINGSQFDSTLRAELEEQRNIRVLYWPTGNPLEARVAGVERLETEFFTFLDDDDLYTPDALAHRLELMQTSPAPDLVVTNFYISDSGEQTVAHPNFETLSHAPRNTIFEFPWLTSLNGLYRTASFDAEDFLNDRKFMEWTALAIRIAAEKRVCFSNHPTAFYFNTADSLSKSIQLIEDGVDLMRSLKRQEYPRRIRSLIDSKCTAGLNTLAKHSHEMDERANAWRYHLRCLVSRGGWKYLGFTRKLF